MKSTRDYSEQIYKLKQAIHAADAVVIGAGAGLSESGGLSYTGKRFEKNFADFISKYHFRDMYSATFYPYSTLEDYWAYMSRHININRYAQPIGEPLNKLLEKVKDKEHFVLTTNVDHQFQKAGIEKSRLFYTQGDYGLWQCSVPCHNGTYDNEETVKKMLEEQKDLRIPTELIPHCPKCGKHMSMNLRCDNTFVQDEGWHRASSQYKDFIRRNGGGKILYLELGVGNNTPVIIKYPFWKMTAANPHATYACINLEYADCPNELEEQSICIKADIGQAMDSLTEDSI